MSVIITVNPLPLPTAQPPTPKTDLLLPGLGAGRHTQKEVRGEAGADGGDTGHVPCASPSPRPVSTALSWPLPRLALAHSADSERRGHVPSPRGGPTGYKWPGEEAPPGPWRPVYIACHPSNPCSVGTTNPMTGEDSEARRGDKMACHTVVRMKPAFEPRAWPWTLRAMEGVSR